MDEKTIQTYNLMAKEYDEETSGFWQDFPSQIIDQFCKYLNGEGNVLNIGSGPGRDGLILKQKGLDVVCLDASESMIDLCKEKGLESVVGDFNNIQFSDKEFDGVWAYTSLLHVSKESIEKSMSEIVRVLKNGGIFGLGLMEGDFNDYRESSGVNKPRWFSFYKKEEVEKWLEKFNFEILYFDEFKPTSKNYLNFVARLR
jgi:ubiquinone/menaquinone biosynthesis C-methylase UbiE